MTRLHSLTAALAGAAFLTAGAASADVLGKKSVTSKEVVGTAAKGDPKPYHALVEGTCNVGICMVNVGKKAKQRRIDLVTCGLVADEDPELGAVIFGDLGDGDVRFFLPVASVAPRGTDKVGLFQFQFGFDVPAGTKLQVLLQTSGTASSAACTATGTIR